MSHRCLGCTDIVTGGGKALRFGPRFEGPPGLANGGVVVGALTCVARRLSDLEDPAVVRLTARLHRGVPQGRDLPVETRVDADGTVEVTLFDGADLLVTAAVVLAPTAALERGRPSVLFGPDRLEPLEALAEPTPAQRRFAAEHPGRPKPDPNPFGRCFVCGTENPEGLRVEARPVAPGLAWAANPCADGVAEADGRLDTVIAVASLDCPSTPSFWAIDVLAPDESVLLGTFDVEFLRLPPAEIEGGYRLPSRFYRRDGRKIYADIALSDARGTLYAVASTTWISVPMPAAL